MWPGVGVPRGSAGEGRWPHLPGNRLLGSQAAGCGLVAAVVILDFLLVFLDLTVDRKSVV